MSRSDEWYAQALDAYRNGRREVDRFKTDPREAVQICIEDLQEVLLDLKEATIAGDRAQVAVRVYELAMLLIDLKNAARGEP